MPDKDEKNVEYIGEKPLPGYIEYGINRLQEAGTVKLMARGRLIARAILVAHRLTKQYAGVRIIDERSSTQELPDDRPREGQEAEKPEMKEVAVIEITLVMDEPKKESSQ